MLMTVEELRKFIETDETDEVLEAKLQAFELCIQGYTNNDFKRHLTAEGEYPMDVKKVGIASESISRHSVTYVDQTGTNTVMGYPVALMGFLKPYKKARFGRGISL